MKDFNISQADKILLRKRAVIESVNDELKNICKLQDIPGIDQSTNLDKHNGRTLYLPLIP